MLPVTHASHTTEVATMHRLANVPRLTLQHIALHAVTWPTHMLAEIPMHWRCMPLTLTQPLEAQVMR